MDVIGIVRRNIMSKTHTTQVVNDILVNLFNYLLIIEKNSLSASEYKNLTMNEWHVLEQIGMNKVTMTELAKQLRITVGTLTTTINRLLKKGYVTRSQAEDDRRFVHVELTKLGEAAYKEHETFHKNMVKSVVAQLDKDDNEALIHSLEKLSEFFMDEYGKQIY